MTPDPHKPLRDDVRRLGELLGQTLEAQGGPELLQRVERVRALAKQARVDDRAFEELAAELSQMPVDAALPVARAFSHFLNLANVAEQHHRIRRRRAYLRDPAAAPQRGSCADAFQRLIAGGIAPSELHAAVCALDIELVLTAHPTEMTRRSLVQKYNRIARLLGERDRGDLTVPEQEDIDASLLREITAAWGTSEVRAEAPTPLDEVRAGLTIFEESLWHAVPRYLRAVDRALLKATGSALPPGTTPIRFGSWIGGDRDGNPNVTPEVTRRACLLARWVAAELYLHDIDALRDELSMTAATPELRAASSGTGEPYRDLLRAVRARMAATLDWCEHSLRVESSDTPPAGVYLDPDAFVAELQLCDDSLRRSGYGQVADGRLADVLRRGATFGMTLARLDIRQDAAAHTEAISAITSSLGLGSYGDWDEPRRVEFLLAELAKDVRSVRLEPDRGRDREPDVQPDLTSDVLDTFRMIARIPRSSLGAYVITMASRASDVLAVEFLQAVAGVRGPLRVVPLFETGRDLRNAGAVLDALLQMPWYAAHIAGRQEVMIGYSDSAKDIGRVAAGWELYKAQEEILRVCATHGVSVTLFHGRGGSIGRGGGPTALALQSQPPGSLAAGLRVTEQGEMLQALFGLPDVAARTLEVYTTGTLEAHLTPPADVRPEWRACMERVSERGRAAYRGVIYEQPRFVEYFRSATPEPELASLRIGSRPARRKAGTDISTLRAIPWQFAWTQTRLLIGAWLGAEDALDADDDRARLREMYREWPHFRSQIDLIEMVLAKADARIAAEYDRRLVGTALHPMGAELRSRLARAIRAVLDVTGHTMLLESNPMLRRSIDVRNPYVDPINLVQIELLRRVRQQADSRAEDALLVTINGVAAGMRNTG